MLFQSKFGSPINRQMLSKAIFTAAGGLAMDRTSTKCCRLIDFTSFQILNVCKKQKCMRKMKKK